MKIIEVNLEDIDLTETKKQVNFSEVKICMAEVNTIKIHTKANIKTIAIKVIITKAIEVYIITHVEISNRAIIMANLEAEAMVVAEVITVAVITAGQIIEVILTTNTISITVMMMSTRQTNIGPPCALCGGYNHSPKHCFKGEHDINDIMEKMNISRHQSQLSGLYS